MENYVWRNPSRCPDRYAQIRQVPSPDRCGQFIGRVLRLLSGVLVRFALSDAEVEMNIFAAFTFKAGTRNPEV